MIGEQKYSNSIQAKDIEAFQQYCNFKSKKKKKKDTALKTMYFIDI